MNKLGIETISYKVSDYIIDVVIDKESKTSDVWIGKLGGKMKLLMFNLNSIKADEVADIVYKSLIKEGFSYDELDNNEK